MDGIVRRRKSDARLSPGAQPIRLHPQLPAQAEHHDDDDDVDDDDAEEEEEEDDDIL